MNILLLGADHQKRNRLGSALCRSGFAVDAASPGDAEWRLSTGKPYALVVLDVAPPAATQAAITSVRRMTGAPLLVLAEPCAMDDFLARAWALTSRDDSADGALLRLADLAIDRKRGKALRHGMDLGLSATLFELLDVLMAHRGRVMSRAGLIKAVWGSSVHHQRDNIVTVAILRLRQKLDDPFDLKLIHTVHRKGYVLEVRHDR
jgi:two-component system copper resistance phosphate regulon response regulator CusR